MQQVGQAANIDPLKSIGIASALPFAMQATGNWEQDQLPGPDIAGQAFDFDYGQMRKAYCRLP